MAEQSRFWNSNDVGDGASAGYARDLIAGWLRNVFARGGSGILKGQNELVASGSASPLSVATGAAIVYGLFYENDAAKTLTVTTPSSGTTGGRVILRANWTAQTVRLAILMNTDGNSAAPALTQTPGTTYEINIATFQISTGGVISNLVCETTRVIFSNSPRAENFSLAGLSVLGNGTSSSGAGAEITAASDDQVLRRSGSALGFGQAAAAGLATGAVTAAKMATGLEIQTAQIANGAVATADLADNAVDDTKAGNRVPQFYRRQGGSASDWNSPGADDYTPTTVRILAGVVSVPITSDIVYGGAVTVTLPVAISKPLCFANVIDANPAPGDGTSFNAYVEVLTDTTIKVTGIQNSVWFADKTLSIAWMVIGPEA